VAPDNTIITVGWLRTALSSKLATPTEIRPLFPPPGTCHYVVFILFSHSTIVPNCMNGAQKNISFIFNTLSLGDEENEN
jgi:hypothetical protein